MSFKLKKLGEESWADYMLSFTGKCKTSARGTTRCEKNTTWFLMKEELKSLKNEITDEYMRNARKDSRE